jgi:class 3 adenylate cyclase
MSMPVTHYAKSGDAHIAYQVFGSGTTDLVLVPGFISHIENYWEHPDVARWLLRLGNFARVIMFDKRGTGLSDPAPSTTQPLEERMDDVLAVMDAVGSERAVLFGASEGGPLAALFAAAHPERCVSLVLYGVCARWLQAPDYPAGRPPEVARLFSERWIEGWGTGGSLQVLAPSRSADPEFRRWWGRFERSSVRPALVRPIIETIEQTDIRDVLPAIRVPTLVLHRSGDRLIDVANGRYLSAQIPNARYVELRGEDHMYFAGDADGLLDEVQEFVTGSRGHGEGDTVLATVMFTDIVQSTELAAQLGDARWRHLLEDHHRVVQHLVAAYRGQIVRSTGDGILATFDGPARAIRCALAVVDAARRLNLDLRAGLHTGELELAGDDLAGVTVHIGARITDLAEPSEVLVSGTVRDLVVGSNLSFEFRGIEALKGVPGEWRLFTVGA